MKVLEGFKGLRRLQRPLEGFGAVLKGFSTIFERLLKVHSHSGFESLVKTFTVPLKAAMDSHDLAGLERAM